MLDLCFTFKQNLGYKYCLSVTLYGLKHIVNFIAIFMVCV